MAPLFKHAAPGNLGRPDLANLPSRSKIALPKMPSLQQHQLPDKAATLSPSPPEDEHIDLTQNDVEVSPDLMRHISASSLQVYEL